MVSIRSRDGIIVLSSVFTEKKYQSRPRTFPWLVLASLGYIAPSQRFIDATFYHKCWPNGSERTTIRHIIFLTTTFVFVFLCYSSSSSSSFSLSVNFFFFFYEAALLLLLLLLLSRSTVTFFCLNFFFPIFFFPQKKKPKKTMP